MGRQALVGLKYGRSLLIAGALAAAIIVFLSLLSGVVFTKSRQAYVDRDALTSHAIPDPYLHLGQDYFTECAFMIMNWERDGNLVHNVVDTRYIVTAPYVHPCFALRRMMGVPRTRCEIVGPDPLNCPLDPADWPTTSPVSYPNYFFGARQLEAGVLSFLTFGQAKKLYTVLSYGAGLALLFAAWRRSAALGLHLAPIAFFLTTAFMLHLFGQNLAHAPQFFVGTYLLALVVLRREALADLDKRVGAYFFIGAMTAFFELIAGEPYMACLLLVVNHVVFVMPQAPALTAGKYLRRTLTEGTVVVLCVFGGYAVVSAFHLLALMTFRDNIWSLYSGELTVRLSSDVGTLKVTSADVVRVLWRARSQLTPGGKTPATVLLGAGAGAWLLSAVLVPLAAGRRLFRPLTDVLPMVGGSLGILAWFVITKNHTYIHAFFMVRLIALPLAFGYIALMRLGSALYVDFREHAPAPSGHVATVTSTP